MIEFLIFLMMMLGAYEYGVLRQKSVALVAWQKVREWLEKRD